MDYHPDHRPMPMPKNRSGYLADIDGFTVFVDTEAYAQDTITAIKNGGYEYIERALVKESVKPGDRVLECGTAIGSISMTAAGIVGAENVLTFEANPEIYADALRNFDRNGLAIDARNGVLRNRKAFLSEHETIEFGISKDFLASRLNAAKDAADIRRRVHVPVFCLEDAITQHRANVFICDIEGGEIDLLMDATLDRIEKIILELHQPIVGDGVTGDLIRKLIADGYDLDLARVSYQFLVLRRGVKTLG
jgi:FkbM family methyltransferase